MPFALPGVQLVYSQLHDPLQKLIQESHKIQKGMVFVPTKQPDLNAYDRLIQKQNGHILGGIETLKSMAASMSQLLSEYDPSPEEMALLRSHVREVLNVRLQREWDI